MQHEGDLTVSEAFKSKPGLQFWSKIMEAIKDSYAVERISEQHLQKLSNQNITDVEGYWILWVLFHEIFELQASIRKIFTVVSVPNMLSEMDSSVFGSSVSS